MSNIIAIVSQGHWGSGAAGISQASEDRGQRGFPCDLAAKEPASNAGDLGSSLGWEDPL